ncbi:MAG: DUF5057 domain-containing protein [Lachnospiraceae bacterium]|nr:DUF5057 domain-containing protein [Lachnospiraceae bacterium]
MHRINAGRGKKIISASIAGVLTVAIVSTALYKDSSVALARPSLPGIEEIVNGNSSGRPFKILEIVDQYTNARIGYTVAGEEPSNKDAQAISDMASYGERKDYFMTDYDSTDPIDNSAWNTAFDELNTKAFAYADYDQGPEPGAVGAYDDKTDGIKTGKSYGTFETNSTTTGRYDDADTSGDYVQVNDGTANTDGHKTIDDVYQKLPGTDQTGYFYMNYAGFLYNGDTTLANNYNILQYALIDTDNSWKFPFKIYEEDVNTDADGNLLVDGNGNPYSIHYQYYDDDRYIFNDPFEAILDENDADDANDDIYTFTTEPADGSVIYTSEDDGRLKYCGYISTVSGVLSLNYDSNNDGTIDKTIPVSARVYEFDPDVNGDPQKDTDGNTILKLDASGNPIPIESFASIALNDLSIKYSTVRKATNGDGAAIKKYYISSTQQGVGGLYELATLRFRAVNDPDVLPEEFGIKDETEKGLFAAGPAGDNTWYHVWYYKSQSNSPYKYNEKPHDGKYDFVHDYTAPDVDTYYYKGGYTNYEWFKKEVLDVDEADCGKICIDVITKKLHEVTADDIKDADLIYFTGNGVYDTDTSGAAIDMQYDAAAALITAVDQENKAVVINLRATNAGTQFIHFGGTIAQTAISLLLQNDVDGISQFVGATDWNMSDEKKTELLGWRLAYYANAGSTRKDLSHVTGSVFVNDNVDTTLDAISTDFTTAYSDAKVSGFTLNVSTSTSTHADFTFDGFKDVQKDIDEEKFYLEVAGKNVGDFNDTISKATSIRYILNYGDRRVVGKTALRVLDLEPYYSRDVEGVVDDYSDNNELKKVLYVNNGRSNVTVENIADVRDIFAINWFKQNVSDTTDRIDVTGIGTKEFIGRIEDLNESYDMIYIGMDTAYINTAISKENNKYYKSKNVVSNDGATYVYRHTGDRISTSNQTGGDGTWNMGGNDITPDKFRELQNYVKAGYAVLLSDEFFKYDRNGNVLKDSKGNLVIDTDRVEAHLDEDNQNSYLYDFVYWCISEKDGNNYKYLYKNVDITRNFENNTVTTDGKTALAHRESFIKYVNISKLQVEVKEQPPLYNPYDTNDSNKHNYLAMNSMGQYALEYTVKLTNDAAVDTTKTNYDCQLYIDHDGDGRFEAVEMLDGIDITNVDNNDYISPDGSGKYHLTTGTTYKIYRTVPEGYVGLVPWKLVFVENRDGDGAALIKTAVQDYSAIADLTNKPTIKILQITSGNSDSTNLNLWNDARLRELYTQVVDFNIQVDHVKSSDFMNRTGTIFGNGVDRLEKMYEYDMLVLGFLDMYSLTGTNTATSKEGILCIREYMLSGRSVLFTHDLTSTRIRNTDGNDWGELADRYLRDIQGMDRYGYIQDNVANLTFSNGTALTEYKSVYDTRYSSNLAKVGFSDSSLLRRSSSDYGDIAAQNTRNLSNSSNGSDKYMDNEREGYSVARVNRGQITEYPFRIGSLEQSNIANGDTNYYANPYITVAKTHHQYFQLDMETDYTDENYDDDIVVWYALSLPGNAKSKYLKLNYNDVRNNFYIYNKGNITYTGAGHSNIGGDEEKKLFVNTLVAAYNAGTHAPYASYKNNDTRLATDITSSYIPYDITFSQTTAEDGGNENGWLQDTVTVYFKTVNNNLQDNRRALIAQYYVEVPSGGDITIGTTQYKIITPVAGSVKLCTITNSGTTYTDVSDPQVLENGRVYKMDFRVSDLMNGDLQGVNTRYHAKIYTRMRCQSKSKSVDEEKADINATGTFTSLSANDSMKPLNVNFTQLYDLK